MKRTLRSFCSFCCQCTLHPEQSTLSYGRSESTPASAKMVINEVAKTSFQSEPVMFHPLKADPKSKKIQENLFTSGAVITIQ